MRTNWEHSTNIWISQNTGPIFKVLTSTEMNEKQVGIKNVWIKVKYHNFHLNLLIKTPFRALLLVLASEILVWIRKPSKINNMIDEPFFHLSFTTSTDF